MTAGRGLWPSSWLGAAGELMPWDTRARLHAQVGLKAASCDPGRPVGEDRQSSSARITSCVVSDWLKAVRATVVGRGRGGTALVARALALRAGVGSR